MKNKFELVFILRIIVEMTAVAMHKIVHIRPLEEILEVSNVGVHRRIAIVLLDMRTVQMKVKTCPFGRPGDDKGIKFTLERPRLVNGACVIPGIKEPAEMFSATRFGADEPAAVEGIARPDFLRKFGIFNERFLLIGHFRPPDGVRVFKTAAAVAF